MVTQQRGAGQAGHDQALNQRIQNLETMLGVNGTNGQAFITVRDKNGLQRVRIGFLPNQDYGVWFSDSTGKNTQVLLPLVSTSIASVSLWSSNGVIPGSPTLTVNVGQSGRMLLRLSAVVIANVFEGAALSVQVSGHGGVAYESILTIQAVGNANGISQSVEGVLTGVTPGLQTVSLYGLYFSGTGGQANAICITAQPL